MIITIADGLWVVLVMILGHFVGDFLLQSRKMAIGKSKSLRWLIPHVIIVGVLTVIPVLFLLGASIEVFYLMLLVMITHAGIDWNIWNAYKSLREMKINKATENKPFKYWEDHLFYTTIGLDQTLHAVINVIGIMLFF